jgi:sulfur relay (sulfurtransferase) DsrC/TusE family protein
VFEEWKQYWQVTIKSSAIWAVLDFVRRFWLNFQTAEWVERVVRSQIIENGETQDEPEHLRTIRDRSAWQNYNSGNQRCDRFLV